jgi:hypothetical protein
MKDAQPLEMVVDTVDIGAEFRSVAENERARAR